MSNWGFDMESFYKTSITKKKDLTQLIEVQVSNKYVIN